MAQLQLARMPVEAGTAVMVGAGDVARCDEIQNAKATAALLERIDGTVFILGDGSNDHGSPDEYASCFASTWGRFEDRLRPAPGNHDYLTPDAAGYFGYHGPRAGEKGKGWYSYDLGSWHVIVLNSNCQKIGGCQKGSPEESWLREDLAAHQTRCTLAYWHHPRRSSGEHGSDDRTADLWRALYGAGAELVVNGHDHGYERFAPLDPDGNPDSEHGIREIISGTGGAGMRLFGSNVVPGSEVRIERRHGVLRLVLREGSYDWQFVATDGHVLDSGSASCHEAPAAL
jgi:hypothetical protein